ncbi:MAG TPA: carbonic anhydrase [Syntrophomonadaceae bacterium]|nr:carbonic anhydrase [Syntrophomonadaceae bacterium]HOQ09661.1 carbonic anhydrase [Syntrophomonadaceae bacterium]HPU49182.1 carbonic anhydrase [Syntrophomonadaceae bacterium]
MPEGNQAYYKRPEIVQSPEEALTLLKEGNQRFVAGQTLPQDVSEEKRNSLVAKGQKPFAVIVSCSDSRLPPELIFDQGLGDLFVVRVAGNVLGPVAMGSVEYGVEHLHAPLLVILGHNHCGAVKASVDGGEIPGSIGAIVAKIKPSVDLVRSSGITGDSIYEHVEDMNVKAMVNEVQSSPIVKELLHEGKLRIIGAKYCQETGKVTFFE